MFAESQAFCSFFSNYPFETSKNFKSLYEYIPALCSIAQSDSPLPCIVNALGLASRSSHADPLRVEAAASSWYNRTVYKINNSIRDCELVKLDQTLLVVLLLGVYETNIPSSPQSMTTWLNHVKGAAALLDLRGEEQLDSELGRSLFIQARTYIIASCYLTRSPIPDIVIQLSQRCRDRSADPLEDLSLIIFQFCNIRAGIPFNPPPNQSESTTRVTAAHYTSVAEQLANWHAGLSPTFLPLIVTVGKGSSDILSEHYDVYEDTWTAAIVNNYRANHLLVHEALISQLAFLRVRYCQDPTELLKLEDQISRSRSTILSLINAICASVPSLLQTKCAAAGVGLLWPLYVAAQISPRTAPVLAATRVWIIGRLTKIDTDMGLHQAAMLAGLLYEDIEVTELLKDG
ncbi:hypothetical protein LTR43_006403 [Exophiala xenobiotica]|nr:hypothetical protein LTR55_009906 [Exophiala xenobiotica]